MISLLTLSLDEHAQSAWNRLWFYWRQFRKVTRPDYCEEKEPKALLFSHSLDLAMREQELRERYRLESVHQRASKLRYLEILAHLDFLEQLLPNGLSRKEMAWLDIGSKNWSYVDALAGFLERQGGGTLSGIEIDAYRLYPDLHSRIDYARHYAGPYKNAYYLPGDLMRHYGKYTVISWFLPFVFLNPCLSWGLPAECFKPLAQLRHTYKMLEPGGVLLIMNQGEVEYNEQKRLLERLQAEHPDFVVEWSGLLNDAFMGYRYPRYGWRCRKQA